MNLMMVWLVGVCRSFWSRVWWSTVSKAFDMSSVTRTVRRGGGFWLKPVAMW